MDEVDKKNKNISNNNKGDDDINKNNNEIKESLIKKNSKKFEEIVNKEKNGLEIKNNEKKVNKSLNKTNDKGIKIKCEQCSISLSPIYDEVFKCYVCPNYNLCKKCKEQNSKKQIHKHNFIKTNNEEEAVQEENLDKNIIHNNIEKDFSSIIDIKDFYLIYCGTKRYYICFEIKNNSNVQYPEGIEIKCDEGSLLLPTESIIKINSLKPNEKQCISLKYEKLESLPSTTYYTFLNFQFNNKKIGQDFYILLKFIETNNYELVDIFINKYNMITFDFTKEQIINCLIKKSCNFRKTLDHLLQKKDPNAKK